MKGHENNISPVGAYEKKIIQVIEENCLKIDAFKEEFQKYLRSDPKGLQSQLNAKMRIFKDRGKRIKT